MYISLAESRANGFRKWSDDHPPRSNDDDGDVARNDAIAIADLDIDYAVMTPPEQTHGPWRVPGVGNAL
jgi:hypothetical protein